MIESIKKERTFIISSILSCNMEKNVKHPVRICHNISCRDKLVSIYNLIILQLSCNLRCTISKAKLIDSQFL